MNELLDKKIDELSFEEAFDRLNKIVDLIEEGGISLDDSIKYYETGISLKIIVKKNLRMLKKIKKSNRQQNRIIL